MNIILLGSSGGIGEAIIKVLIQNKQNRIYCFQRSPSKNNTLQKKIFIGDLNDQDHFLKNLNKINKKIKFDALICNYGVTFIQKSKILSLSNFNFSSTVQNNLISVFNNINLCLNTLKFKKNISSFVLISSLSAHLGFPNNPGYIASKGGVSALTRSFMKDFSNYGFRFNSISPGYIKTKMTSTSWKLKKKFIENHIPLRRWGKPNEIANVVEFLISNKSSYINGQDIVVDGGWSKNSFYTD